MTKKIFSGKFGMICFGMFVSVLMLSSCKKDDNSGPSGPAAEGTIQASVNGKTVTSLKIATFANRISGNLAIQGNTGGTSSEAFSLLITSENGVGTYPIGGGANIANSAAYIKTQIDLSNPGSPKTETWQAPYDATQAGEIKITEISTTNVKGTFNFKAKRSDGNIVDVTNGSFNINF